MQSSVQTTTDMPLEQVHLELSPAQGESCGAKQLRYVGPVRNQSDPIFTNHHVSVPFGCSPQQIESELLKFVLDLVSPREMQHIKRLFFVPVGLPGMGKSTLSKHIKQAVDRNLSDANLIKTQKQDQNVPLITERYLADLKKGDTRLPTVSYHKVSYDRILGENLSAYSELHPEVPFHEVIDIIRSKADQDYLD